MKLKTILEGIPVLDVTGDLETEISAVVLNSQQVTPGTLFIALQGSRHDGHQFVAEAIARGAAAVMVERTVDVKPGVVRVIVEDTQAAQALVGKNFYQDPASKLKLIGVTGTKGKTTTTYLIRSLLNTAGLKTGLIGTIANIINERKLPARNSTPVALELQQLLAEMVKAGMEYVVMEVSSHGIALNRIAGLSFLRGIFTNISRDHLDFHHTFDEYFRTKTQFFQDLPPDGLAIVNLDDQGGQQIAADCRSLLSYGLTPEAQIRAEQVVSTMHETQFTLVTPAGRIPVTLNLLGHFNVYNALAAAALGYSLGLELDVLRQGLNRLTGVPGRFELVPGGKGYKVVVDYAHSPDSLENVLLTAQSLAKNRVITVFGCGGNRDQGKRPIMGRIAARLSSHSIITNDNPRREAPQAIADQIKEGFEEEGQSSSYEVILDRAAAIKKAVSLAQEGDLVLIAGKGHETYQDFGEYKVHFDDKEIAALAMKEKEDA
ncbi:MAG: UDP-N-acetylmuramoyl-L-alanyl-D-glutamate--2,6-diaminopimelate ligase [Firmicutes bacterium]|nr:UDP-N-acetylmuramoyl-L-alanyl-D-glutamate--2,6-diaminopimelate ligase [Bacillota bacterium]